MKRRKFNHKEQDELQKLKRENDRLKRQVSSLRKQIDRLDIDRYENLQDLIHKYDKEEAAEIVAKEKKAEEQKWRCFECPDGILKLRVFHRQDGVFYDRKCDKCTNKTKMKKWDKSVEGVE